MLTEREEENVALASRCLLFPMKPSCVTLTTSRLPFLDCPASAQAWRDQEANIEATALARVPPGGKLVITQSLGAPDEVLTSAPGLGCFLALPS